MKKETISSICEKFGNEIANKVDYEFSHKFNHTLHAYIDITGNLIEGTLLSQILYWFSNDKNGCIRARIKRNGEYWIAKRRDEWWNEIRITDRQFDCAIKKLREKGFVILEKHKFDSMPTIYIRPDYDVINPALEKWKENLAKEILSKQMEEASRENGNYALCNSPGNDTMCKTGITKDVTLLTEITNRDYNTENTNKKDAFTNVNDRMDALKPKVSKGSPLNYNNNKTEYTEEQLKAHIIYTVDSIMKSEYMIEATDELCVDLKKIILYFYHEYNEIFLEKHPILSDISYGNIADRYMNPSGRNMSTDMVRDFETYKKMIDRYFQTDFGRYKGTPENFNYRISHFMSDTVRENLYMKLSWKVSSSDH